MKHIAVILVLLVGMHAAAQCKWGLSPDYKAAGLMNNGDASNNEAACRAAEETAASRMVRAKTICYSGDSTVLWSKTDKRFDPSLSLRQMRVAENVATGYTRIYACERADLVTKILVDHTDLRSGTVSVEVTDADSGEVVYKEDRNIADEANDLYRLIRHFREARTQAKAQLQEAALAAVAEEEEKTKYDEVRHPTLGLLRFPKTMSPAERSVQIAKMELDAEDSRLSDQENYLKVREEALSKKSADLRTRSDAFELRKKVYASNVTNYNQRCANGGYLCQSDAYTLNKEHDSIEATRVVLNDELEKCEQERKDISKAETDASEARRKLDSKMAEFGMKSKNQSLSLRH
jgi:hypothetical protein